METWFIIIVSLCVAALLKTILSLFSPSTKHLPPGPPAIPLIGNFIWLRKPISDLEQILRRLKPRYGPIITIKIAHRFFVFVAGHSIAHQALVQNGAVFADRPGPPVTSTYLNAPRKTISSSSYGPTWRLLRRNLTQEILHPSRVRGYSASRRWVLSLLMDRIRGAADSESSVRLIDHFQYAMFCLLVLLCFGDKLQESQIKEIETIQRKILLSFQRFNVLNFWPRLGRIIFRKRWKELFEIRDEQDRILIPLIRARVESKRTRKTEDELVAYVDTLADLVLPEEKRKLEEEEMVSLCSEFLSAGTDTTSTALQWIMANLVKHQEIQEKLYQEIVGVVESEEVVEEEDLQKMPYLKAVVLEALRRHPPGHFVLPHKVKEEVELDGYRIPKDAYVNFMVADMNWDAEVWEEPMEFKPERFVAACEGEGFDVTGSREIKMMPFGAGRRVCPGFALALLHLEYFVANLIRSFKWEADGDVDLTEKQEFTIVMKSPLRATISPRN
ncbi:cytochrome P450 89A2-like [Salvia miltiorrhiza]|uniref:Cytochrome P450 CYP89A115 n=1 Tax=Salvia miltiorrhiza TaxID=226208 RepID=A0A0B4VST5_SALMI|nr:cytochrome P450 89A2-like [Salvia miltiorrhiza]AJD25210.1 cytochrome P450 CYP89A115 [Salvia miltiorrhiza]